MITFDLLTLALKSNPRKTSLIVNCEAQSITHGQYKVMCSEGVLDVVDCLDYDTYISLVGDLRLLRKGDVSIYELSRSGYNLINSYYDECVFDNDDAYALAREFKVATEDTYEHYKSHMHSRGRKMVSESVYDTIAPAMKPSDNSPVGFIIAPGVGLALNG